MMNKNQWSAFSITMAIAISMSMPALAAKSAKPSAKTSQQSQMSKEDRNQMAEMHQKMAECLKSDKPMSECRSLMMEQGGEGDCSMRQEHRGHGKKHKAAPAHHSAEGADE
jgi:hypothetical protein